MSRPPPHLHLPACFRRENIIGGRDAMSAAEFVRQMREAEQKKVHGDGLGVELGLGLGLPQPHPQPSPSPHP